MRKSLILTLLILFCASQALAWNDGGHKLVAASGAESFARAAITIWLSPLQNDEGCDWP
jgi:hypothetical protein